MSREEEGDKAWGYLMIRKEAIIRYLAQAERANRQDIAKAIKASPELTSVHLTELRHTGDVRNAEWPDGSKLWFLTPRGEGRFHYYERKDKDRAG